MSLNNYISKQDWLEARKSGIGGSDASAIIGLNPYKTNVELWEEKTGRKKSENISNKPEVIYGKEAEKHLRELFKLDYPDYKVQHTEYEIRQSVNYPFMLASLDGELIDKKGESGVLEIKTTNILQSMQKEKWTDKIPDNYYIQILHYLIVTGYQYAILKAQLRFQYGEDVYLNTKHYRVERSECIEDINYLIEEEGKFWRLVESDTRPHLRLPII
jgi:putative phage-type endonuclease